MVLVTILEDVPPCTNESLICNRPKYCVGSEEVRIVDPVNTCNGYYYCLFGELIFEGCPASTIFDSSSSFCQCRFAQPEDVCTYTCTPPSVEPNGPEGMYESSR